MKSKDAAFRSLEQHNDVFADILRVLILKKGFQIHPGELSERSETVSIMADQRGVRSQSRDVVKCWKTTTHMTIIGLENQSEIDPNMPLRVYAYNGGSYKVQLLSLKSKTDQKKATSDISDRQLAPVMTIVIYTGIKQKWRHPVRISDVVNISEAIRKSIHEEQLIVINLAWLSLRQIRCFNSDFRHVAKMLRCLRLKKTYRPPKNIRLDHPVEFGQVWYACTKDPRIAEFFENDRDKEVKMCEFLDSIEARGFKKGEKRGEKRGRETERRENKLVAEYLKSLGKSDEFSDLLDHPRKYRRYLKEAMAVYESVGVNNV